MVSKEDTNPSYLLFTKWYLKDPEADGTGACVQQRDCRKTGCHSVRKNISPSPKTHTPLEIHRVLIYNTN